jgi:predicted site-specific integrase-resolvase
MPHQKVYKMKDFERDLGIPHKTLWQWIKTGKIKKFYEKQLIRMGVLKEEIPDEKV